MPTSNSFGKGSCGTFFRISESTPGAILQPQPPPCEREVRRGSFSEVSAFWFMLNILNASLLKFLNYLGRGWLCHVPEVWYDGISITRDKRFFCSGDGVKYGSLNASNIAAIDMNADRSLVTHIVFHYMNIMGSR